MKDKVKSINLSKLTLIIGLIFGQIELWGQGSGGTVTSNGIRKIHTFSTSGTLTPVIGVDSVGLPAMYYTLVGGGGGGGSPTGIGGGGGEVINLNSPGVNYRSTNLVTVTVGTGGASNAIGGSSSLAFTTSQGNAVSLAAIGGNSNGTALVVGNSRASDTATLTNFNPGTSITGGNPGYGGGAGNSRNGNNGASTIGGAGGRGRSVRNAAGTQTTYAGGGGGCGKNTQGSGSNGGGNGNYGPSAIGTSGAAGSGGGGGGADGGGTPVGGTGGSGIVIISYEGFDYFSGAAPGAWTWLNTSTLDHTSGAAVKFFTSTSLGASSWGTDDIYVKSGQTLTIDGAVVCRNLYCYGSVVIGTGSLTVNNTFFAQRAQAIPQGTYKNIWCTQTSGVVSISGNLSISGDLNIVNSNGIFDISHTAVRTFTCGGLIKGSGHIKGNSNAILVYTGSPTSSSSTLYMDSTTQGTTNVLRRLELGTNAKLRLMNNLFITADRTNNTNGDIALAIGSLLETNDSANVATPRLPVATNGSAIPPRLFLKRSNTTTLHHPILNLQGGQIVGEVWYEDYFEAGSKSWRQTGHVLDSALSLNQLTSDDLDLFATVSSGTGTRGGNPNGLLQSTSAALPSIFLYDENQLNASSSNSRWVPYVVNGATNYTIPVGSGVMLFMRPFGSGASGSYSGQQYDYEGELNTSNNVTVTCKKSTNTNINTGYNLLSNPYPAYLNLESFLTDPSNVNKILAGSVGSGSGAQAIYKYNKSSKNYDPTYKSSGQWKNSTGTTLTNPNLDPGDAFFVRVKTDGDVLTFKPTHTSTISESNIDRGNKLEIDTAIYYLLNIKLTAASDNSIGDVITITSSKDPATLAIGDNDVLDMRGTCLDFAVQSAENKSLAVKQVSSISTWTIPLKVATCLTGQHSFTCSVSSINTMDEAKFELLDVFTGTKQKISNGDKINFEVTSDPASQGIGRFFVISGSTTASLKNVLSQNSLQVFPNPVINGENINIITNSKGNGTFSVFDAFGKLVFEKQFDEIPAAIKLSTQAFNCKPGLYYVRLSNNREIAMTSILITNNN